MRRSVLALVLVLFGCAHMMEFPRELETDDWRAQYATCSSAGEAYYAFIPLAARDQQELSQRFVPSDPSHCLLYVVRMWNVHGRANVFLYRSEMAPVKPESFGFLFESKLLEPVWLDRHLKDTPREFRKAEIVSPNVFAMWELEPGTYVLDASTEGSLKFDRATIQCTAGRTLYWGVKEGAISVLAHLKELDAEEGQARARHRLVSAGIQPRDEQPIWRGIQEEKCPADR
jgi:hypothetical protein